MLFLDELPEFNRRTLEVLRQPLESGNVTISRAMGSVTFPASLMLVAALNPCPCGYRGDPRRQCNCSPLQVEKYIGKISGPLLDRIDIHLEVASVPFRELSDQNSGTTSSQMREQVVAAREVQKARFQSERTTLNGRMTPRQIRKHIKLDAPAESLFGNRRWKKWACPLACPRQNPARLPHNRRSGPERHGDHVRHHLNRSDQLPHAGSELLGIASP